MSKPITREEARRRFEASGQSVWAFARELEVHPMTVFRVLNGSLKGMRGDAHRVAVALGLKEGVITPPGGSVTAALRAAGQSMEAS